MTAEAEFPCRAGMPGAHQDWVEAAGRALSWTICAWMHAQRTHPSGVSNRRINVSESESPGTHMPMITGELVLGGQR